jgi:hypothetical protein
MAEAAATFKDSILSDISILTQASALPFIVLSTPWLSLPKTKQNFGAGSKPDKRTPLWEELE